MTLRIITKTLFDLDDIEATGQIGQAFTAVVEHTPRFGRRLGLWSWGRDPRLAGKMTLDALVYRFIAQRRAEGQDTGDVLSMLLEAQENGERLTDEQVHDQVLTFIAAGHETAQNTLCWTFCLLSRSPGIMEKVQQELGEVLDGRAPTVEDLARLTYLEAVLNEAWRFYPPAWAQTRQAVEEVLLDGYRFPAGTVFMINQWVLHRRPDLWGDPDSFRPERWQDGQKVPQGTYFPFGAGPRICIGMPFAQMEARLLLATILQRFTPQLAPGFQVELQPRVTIRPKYGMQMILQPPPTFLATS